MLCKLQRGVRSVPGLLSGLVCCHLTNKLLLRVTFACCWIEASVLRSTARNHQRRWSCVLDSSTHHLEYLLLRVRCDPCDRAAELRTFGWPQRGARGGNRAGCGLDSGFLEGRVRRLENVVQFLLAGSVSGPSPVLRCLHPSSAHVTHRGAAMMLCSVCQRAASSILAADYDTATEILHSCIEEQVVSDVN